MFEQIRAGLLRMTPVAIGIAPVSEVCVIATREIMATHAGYRLVGQRVVGPSSKLIYNRYVTYSAEGTFLIDQLERIG